MSYRGVPPTTVSLPVLPFSPSHGVEFSDSFNNAVLPVYAGGFHCNNADGAEVAENEITGLSCNGIRSTGSRI